MADLTVTRRAYTLTVSSPGPQGPAGSSGDIPAYVYSAMSSRPYLWTDITGITPSRTQRAYLPALSRVGKVPNFAWGYNREGVWDETAEVFKLGPTIENSIVRGYSSNPPSGPAIEIARELTVYGTDSWDAATRNPTTITALSSKFGFDVGTMHRRWDGPSTIGDTPDKVAIGTVYLPPHVNGSIQSVRLAFSRGIDGGTF